MSVALANVRMPPVGPRPWAQPERKEALAEAFARAGITDVGEQTEVLNRAWYVCRFEPDVPRKYRKDPWQLVAYWLWLREKGISREPWKMKPKGNPPLLLWNEPAFMTASAANPPWRVYWSRGTVTVKKPDGSIFARAPATKAEAIRIADTVVRGANPPPAAPATPYGVSGWRERMPKRGIGRRAALKLYGAKAFLDPAGMRYPVVDPRTGRYDPQGVLAAYKRAAQQGEPQIVRKALSLAKRLGLPWAQNPIPQVALAVLPMVAQERRRLEEKRARQGGRLGLVDALRLRMVRKALPLGLPPGVEAAARAATANSRVWAKVNPEATVEDQLEAALERGFAGSPYRWMYAYAVDQLRYALAVVHSNVICDRLLASRVVVRDRPYSLRLTAKIAGTAFPTSESEGVPATWSFAFWRTPGGKYRAKAYGFKGGASKANTGKKGVPLSLPSALEGAARTKSNPWQCPECGRVALVQTPWAGAEGAVKTWWLLCRDCGWSAESPSRLSTSSATFKRAIPARKIGKRRLPPRANPPLPASLQKYAGVPGFAAAVRKYVEFHGCAPTKVTWHRIPLGGARERQFMVGMGRAPAESYEPPKGMRSNKRGSSWVHEYKRKPMKATDATGRLIVTLPGSHRVQDWIRG